MSRHPRVDTNIRTQPPCVWRDILTMLAGNNRLSGWTASSTDGFAGAAVVLVRGASTEGIGTNPGLGRLWVSNDVAVATPAVHGTNFTVSAMPLRGGTNIVGAAIGDVAGNVGYASVTLRVDVVTAAAFQHSAAGCVTNMVYSGGGLSRTNELSWDSRYELIAVLTNGAVAEAYGYDVASRRAWTFDGSATNWHVYDGAHVVADMNGTGGVIRTYVWGPGVDNMLAMIVHAGAVAKTYYALTDHLGTVHALADGTGAIAESYSFDAWGRLLSAADGEGNLLRQSALGNRYLWQGREYSWKTGLYYFRARWYDPVTGRWLSNDPIGISGGLNQYVFARNNPVNFRDPWGLCEEGEGGGFWDWAQGVLDAGGVVEPTPFCDLTSALISACRGNWGDMGWSLAGVVPYVGDLGKVGKYGNKALRYSDDAAALVDLAKQAKRTGVTPAEAETLLKWADEYNVRPARGPEIHPGRNFDKEHIRIGPENHIPVNR